MAEIMKKELRWTSVKILTPWTTIREQLPDWKVIIKGIENLVLN